MVLVIYRGEPLMHGWGRVSWFKLKKKKKNSGGRLKITLVVKQDISIKSRWIFGFIADIKILGLRFDCCCSCSWGMGCHGSWVGFLVWYWWKWMTDLD